LDHLYLLVKPNKALPDLDDEVNSTVLKKINGLIKLASNPLSLVLVQITDSKKPKFSLLLTFQLK
jgi:hypothetical protein